MFTQAKTARPTRRAASNQQGLGHAIAIFNERDTFLSTKQVPPERRGCQLIGRDDRGRRFVRRARHSTTPSSATGLVSSTLGRSLRGFVQPVFSRRGVL
ncbi:hypothetical protein LSAT2_017003 [Lamellibrachia satsuma]|nr:hypothetical protein LSAT2_017003 [Lamellibrachia satsuma]